jgi:hypothetical protein
MMSISTITETNLDGTTTGWVLIDHGNNEFTSILQSAYDEMLAQQAAHIEGVI